MPVMFQGAGEGEGREMTKGFSIAVFAACFAVAPVRATMDAGNATNGLTVTATVFPLFDWARQIAGGKARSLNLLLDGGVDFHSYQPSAGDIVRILSSDVFLYTGGASDAWLEELLARNAGTNVRAVSLLKLLGGAVKAESQEGCVERECRRHCRHGHGAGGAKPDEHVWLSLRLAQKACARLAEVFAERDPANAASYRANADAYLSELRALDDSYGTFFASAPRKALLFGDRYPFRYLADDYGLTCYAAFPGCSSETSASFKTVVSLAEKMDELALPAILILEGSDGRIAGAILRNTKRPDRPVLTLNAMQGIAKSDVERGVTYLGIMRQNLETLKKAVE